MTNRRRRDDDDAPLPLTETEYSGGGGRGAHLPEEENPFTFVVTKGERKEGKDSGKPYFNWLLSVKSGKYKGKKVYHITSLQYEALWNLRGMLKSAGVAIRDFKPSQAVKVLTGKTVKANVIDDEYNNKVKSVIDEWVIEGDEDAEDDEDEEEEEEEEEDDEEEKPAPGRRASASTATRKAPAKPARNTRTRRRRPAAEEEEEDEDEDIDDLELDDL